MTAIVLEFADDTSTFEAAFDDDSDFTVDLVIIEPGAGGGGSLSEQDVLDLLDSEGYVQQATIDTINDALADLGSIDATLSASITAEAATRLAQDNLLAPKANPTFTGTVTLPGNAGSALQATPLQQVQSLIAAAKTELLGGAPAAALDTLLELGERLLDDEDAVSALTTTVASKLAIAQNLADLADVAQARINLGLRIGTDVQAYSSTLATIAAITTTLFGRGFLSLTDAAAARAYLELGTAATHAHSDYQAASAILATLAALSSVANLTTLAGLSSVTNLSALAGLTGAADKGIRFTAAGTMATFDQTSFGRTLAGLADQAAAASTLKIPTSLLNAQGPALTGISGTPQSFLTSALAVSSLAAGDRLEAVILAEYSNASGGSRTLDVVASFGANSLSVQTASVADAAVQVIEVSVDIFALSTSVQEWAYKVTHSSGAAGANGVVRLRRLTGNQDTTSSKNLDVTINSSGAGGTQTARAYSIRVRKIPA